MKLLFTAILVFVPKVFPSSDNERGLRGAVNEKSDRERERERERERLPPGTNTTSLAFSVVQASSDSCFDPHKTCLEIGYTYAGTSTLTNVTGNAFAVAFSEQSLWLESTCDAFVETQALACSFTKVDGEIKVDTTQANGYKEVSLSLKVNTATKTIAFASSKAMAESYTGIEAQSFTNLTAFCATVGNRSILCGGSASTELMTVANASSDAFGAAGSLAKSGSVTRSALQVSARGSSMDYINGRIRAYAKSWSFADASTLVSAFAKAYVNVTVDSFMSLCIVNYGNICSNANNTGYGICNMDASSACALAMASGNGYGEGLSKACATAYAEAEATATVRVGVSANVMCKNVPKLTWSCTGADADTVCSDETID